MALADGTVVAETPEEGIEFYVKDGNFCVVSMWKGNPV